MNRRGGPEGDQIIGIRISLGAAVHKIDVHLGDEVVFLFFARRKEEFLSRGHAVGGALTFNAAIGLFAQRKFFYARRIRLFDDCADWQLLFRSDDNPLISLSDVIEQNSLANSTAAIR